MDALTLLVIAKAPVPGRVKTRLTPPCSPEQAAGLAHAALHDTLAAVSLTPAGRRVLVLDGDPAGVSAEGFEVIAQRPDGGLDARLEGAFAGITGPALLVGMDTPQLTPELLAAAVRELERDESTPCSAPPTMAAGGASGSAAPSPAPSPASR